MSPWCQAEDSTEHTDMRQLIPAQCCDFKESKNIIQQLFKKNITVTRIQKLLLGDEKTR